MKNNKRKVRYLILVLLLLFISIGYAYLNSTLNIIGSSTINNPTWDIHWENVEVKQGSVSASTPTIDTNKTTVTYSVNLTTPGDFYEFTVDAVNAGTIDGMVSVISNKLNGTEINTLPNYLEYSVSYYDDYPVEEHHLLLAGESEKYKVHVGYKRDISSGDIPQNNQTLTFNFSVTYVQSDENAKSSQSFGRDSWTTIVNNVKNNTIPDYYTVGSTKEVDMGDFGIHTIRIANKSTPTECSIEGFSQTACGFVLEFADIITTHYMNSTSTNVGGWPASSMRTYVNTDIYNALPTELKNGIIDTKVVSGHGSNSGETDFTSIDKLYLVDVKEILGSSLTTTYVSSKSFERQLDYYSLLGVTTSNYSSAIKQYNDLNIWWWLRSGHANYVYSFCTIDYSGDWSDNAAKYDGGVSPAFRIG